MFSKRLSEYGIKQPVQNFTELDWYQAWRNKNKMENKTNNTPIENFRTGSINVSVWENERINKETGEKYPAYNVNVQKRYKDGEEWKETKNLTIHDIPKIQVLLRQAYEYLLFKE